MKAVHIFFLFICRQGMKGLPVGALWQPGSSKILKNMLLISLVMTTFISIARGQQQIEALDRGIVAVQRNDTSVFVGWRLLGTDPDTVAFNVYRGDTRINDSPVMNATNYIDSNGTAMDTYHIVPVLGGVEQAGSDTVQPWSVNYRSIPLQIPAGDTVPGGVYYTYNANDCSTGDLDGDGEYEIVLKWDPSNSKDNSQDGYTGNVILDGYKMDGTLLWRIDLGINIRAGAHYTQFMVYDLDGDGKAEVACKTAPGTKDASGGYIKLGPAASADHTAGYRNKSGYILEGPEYFTVFNGLTGLELATTDYIPPRGNLASWGDTYGNRVDRFLACIAYLDGTRPSVVMCRGYYTGSGRGRTVLAAWDYRDDTLTHRWTFSADYTGENAAYTGQGNHNLSVGDVDGDGKDEIIYGSMAVDDDGTGLWTTGLRHGDAMHLSDIDPNRPGLEVFGIHEGADTPGSALLDAKTGAVLWQTPNADVGRGVAADMIATVPGLECWGGTDGLVNAKNVRVGNSPGSANHVIWWDGDLTRELLDDNYIAKYVNNIIFTATGCASNNGTKKNPALQADLFGDWREEVIFRTANNAALRIFTTTIPTSYRVPALMHDHIYRMGIAWQNVAYNQPPHLGYYLSPEALLPDSLRPPPPPYDIKALATNDTVKLSWKMVEEADLDGFNVYRSEATQDNFIQLNGEILLDLSYVDSVVTNDIAYYYTVTALDTLGNESRLSDIVKAIPTLRPDAPGGVYARNDVEKIKIFWNPVATGNVTGYNVYRTKTPGKSYIKLNTELLTETSYLNAPLGTVATYYFVVTSVDDNGRESFYSAEVTSAPGPVTRLQEDEGIVSGGSIDNNNIGFNGNGFLNFGSTSTVDFINIGGNQGGTYRLVYRYALGNTSRTGSLVINGVAQSHTMKSLGSDWTVYDYDSVVITLNAGFTNTIRFASTGSDFGNLDEITVKPALVSGTDPVSITAEALILNLYPNPFTDRTWIEYSMNEPGEVMIQVVNLVGQTVVTLTDAVYEPGQYRLCWDACDPSGKKVPEGIYFCRLMINSKCHDITKMILTGR